MPFLQSCNRQPKKSTAHSLQAYLEAHQGSQVHLFFTRLLKRASFITARKRGSMTLEAAFALPFFLFAVLNILFAVNIIGAQSRINAALHQVGNQMAFSGYAYEHTVGNALPDGLAGVALSEGYARSRVIEYAGRPYLEKSCVKGGAGGLSFAGSSVMGEGDVIDLKVSYRVKPFVELLGFDGFLMSQRYYGKAWTGYDGTGQVSDFSQEDPMVYITKTGTVYHLNRGCTYLNPKTESVSVGAVAGRRNASGGKYAPCGICGAGEAGSEVYITNYGSSYHRQLNCPGLKRTIYTVPLSEVGTRGRCSKCG